MLSWWDCGGLELGGFRELKPRDRKDSVGIAQGLEERIDLQDSRATISLLYSAPFGQHVLEVWAKQRYTLL